MHGTLRQSGFEQRSFKLLQVDNVSNSGEVRYQSHISISERDLKTGDLLRVFNSIEQAEKLLNETIHFETDQKHHQTYPKDVDRALWCALFSMRLPARLTKPDGSVFDGVLEPFSEQGMEGFVAWSVYDFNNNSYGSLHTMEDGDVLTVFSKVTSGNVLWEGQVELKEEPAETGKDITLVSIRDNGEDSPPGIDMRTVPETIAKTHIVPDPDQLREWSLRSLPAQILAVH